MLPPIIPRSTTWAKNIENNKDDDLTSRKNLDEEAKAKSEESKINTRKDESSVVIEENIKIAAKTLETRTDRGSKAGKPLDMNEFKALDERTKKGKATDEDEKRFEEIIPIFAKMQVEGHTIPEEEQGKLYK